MYKNNFLLRENMNADFKFIWENNVLEWIFCSKIIRLNIPRLDAAKVDPVRQLVFAISEPEPLPTVLKIFNFYTHDMKLNTLSRSGPACWDRKRPKILTITSGKRGLHKQF